MEHQEQKTAAPPPKAVRPFDSGGTYRPPTAAAVAKDGVAAYIDRNLDMNALSGDIQKIVATHIENSIPDDKKLMLELVNQVGELTGEVKQLRQQLDTKPYAVFSCPSGQMKDITVELAEIKALLQTEPRPRELSPVDIDSIILGPGKQTEPKRPEPPPPPLTPEAHPMPQTAPVEPPPPPTASPPQSGPAQPVPVQTAPNPAVPPAAEPAAQAAEPEKPKKKKALSIVGNILFYVVVIGVVLGAFLVKSGSGGSPTVIAGYSAFTVLSSSMEDTYPKGSLIVTHSVDPNELEIGDDITYMVSATSSITHRIIGITEDYLDTGARAFETQGTMNENPDKDPAAAANVVGKVVFCSVLLGTMASFVSANWPLLIFFVVVLAALFAFLKWNFKREDAPAESKAPKTRKR